MKDLFAQILEAARRLDGIATVTPVMTSRTLDRLVGAKVFLKCENFQRAGAFKFRGAYNAISQLTSAELQQGVITYSSGNHAQAVALVAKILGTHATIVMPNNAPATKKAATEAYGATVVEHDPDETTREDVAKVLQIEHRFTLIKPYDDNRIIAGQGTAALELHDQVPELDMILSPCGGGGLLSGTAVATRNVNPRCRVTGIEPELADDATRSFRTRELQTVHNPPTIAVGVRTPSLGEITFPLVLSHVDDMRTVSEGSIIEAVKFLFYRMKLVVEPAGALGVAALLSGAVEGYRKVGVIVSGGNIDGPTMRKILAS